MNDPLDEMRRDGFSERRRRAFAESRRASADHVRTGLAAVLAWNQALREIFGEDSSTPMGYLALIAVRSGERRRGVGARLLSSLRDTLDGRGGAGLRADGRAYNGFYGNYFAPLAPFWGTTEGVAGLSQRAQPHEAG